MQKNTKVTLLNKDKNNEANGEVWIEMHKLDSKNQGNKIKGKYIQLDEEEDSYIQKVDQKFNKQSNPPISQQQSRNRQSNVPYNYYYNPNLIKQTTNQTSNQGKNNANRMTSQNQSNKNNIIRVSNRNQNNLQRNSNIPSHQPSSNFRRSVPQMTVNCDKCTFTQTVPGNIQLFICCMCNEMSECYPLYGIFTCGVCHTNIIYPYNVSPLIKCTRCSTVNRVSVEPKKQLKQSQIGIGQIPVSIEQNQHSSNTNLNQNADSLDQSRNKMKRNSQIQREFLHVENSLLKSKVEAISHEQKQQKIEREKIQRKQQNEDLIDMDPNKLEIKQMNEGENKDAFKDFDKWINDQEQPSPAKDQSFPTKVQFPPITQVQSFSIKEQSCQIKKDEISRIKIQQIFQKTQEKQQGISENCQKKTGEGKIDYQSIFD